MKPSDQEYSSKQRLDAFINKICPPPISNNDNDNPIQKSRWAKWRFIQNSNDKQVEFQQREKSESKIINRLLDRLDPSAGKARHAARREILSLLEKNGIAITADIRKHLPDSRKLGNINELGKSIKESILDKSDKLSQDRDKFAKLVGKHAAEKALGGEIDEFLRDSKGEAYNTTRELFTLAFKSTLIDFAENLIKEISLMQPPVSEEKLLKFIEKKFENLYKKLINDATWEELRTRASFAIKSELDELEDKIKDRQEKEGALDKILNNSLIFAGVSNFLSETISGYEKEFVNTIKKLLNMGNDQKVNEIFLRNIVSGLTNLIKKQTGQKAKSFSV